MTPEIVSRSFTNDSAVFDSVFFNNIYKLKGNKDKSSVGKIIVDIGAHAGFFSFLALNLGARKVYSFEPYIDNFNVLLKNCYNPHFVGRITPYQLGVNTETGTSLFDPPQLVDGMYFDLAGVKIAIDNQDGKYACPCQTLDEILRIQCFNEKIDVLKINIGYAEREILLTSFLLSSNVNSICGEITANDAQLDDFKFQLGKKGFVNFFSEPPTEEERVLFRCSQGNLSDNFI